MISDEIRTRAYQLLMFHLLIYGLCVYMNVHYLMHLELFLQIFASELY